MSSIRQALSRSHPSPPFLPFSSSMRPSSPLRRRWRSPQAWVISALPAPISAWSPRSTEPGKPRATCQHSGEPMTYWHVPAGVTLSRWSRTLAGRQSVVADVITLLAERVRRVADRPVPGDWNGPVGIPGASTNPVPLGCCPTWTRFRRLHGPQDRHLPSTFRLDPRRRRSSCSETQRLFTGDGDQATSVAGLAGRSSSASSLDPARPITPSRASVAIWS